MTEQLIELYSMFNHRKLIRISFSTNLIIHHPDYLELKKFILGKSGRTYDLVYHFVESRFNEMNNIRSRHNVQDENYFSEEWINELKW